MEYYEYGAAILCFAVTVILARIFIPVLKSAKMGQKILDIGPRWHKSKEGTPTMGGLFFLVPILVCGSIAAILTKEYYLLIHLGFMLLCGVTGFIDDYAKFRKKQNAGLTPTQKMLFQFVSAVLYVVVLLKCDLITPELALPFSGTVIPMNLTLYCVLAVFGIVFTVNSVNLTDGVDGLASCITVVVMLLLAVVSVRTDNTQGSIVCASVIGGLLGFLVYNFHPAKVFMGDTGSLFLGGAVSVMAFVLDKPLLLLFAGFMYYVESFSVIIQVISFKLTGKRVFRMSPIHHHFEMGGWSENKVVTVFSLTALVVCAVGCIGYLPTI